MKITITAHAQKQLKKIPKAYQIMLVQKIKRLSSESNVGSEKVSGYKNYYKNRVGIYRIVFVQKNNEIEVALIAHRKEVYLLLKRLFN